MVKHQTQILKVGAGVKKLCEQHLDETEDINVKLLSEDEVRRMLRNDEIKQALMAAPLLKHLANL